MANRKKEKKASEPQTRERIGEQFARITAPKQLNDPDRREKWGLPADEKLRGDYIIELNLQHIGGLPGAISEFRKLVNQAVKAVDANVDPPTPDRISKSYYRCKLSVREWRKLLELDDQHSEAEAQAAGNSNCDPYRSIFRLWPDFPVSSQVYRSIPTIKADAALRSFDATGRGIVWAVVDSGIQADHPHFGTNPNSADHVLLSKDVRDLHRSFVIDAKTQKRLDDPDIDPEMKIDNLNQLASDQESRDTLVDKHRQAALSDESGHGTHVAGIISGHAPHRDYNIQAIERQFKVDPATDRVESQFHMRRLDEPHRTRGVATQCKLVSLRVLDQFGNGRSSDVIRALEYIREKINDDTRLMRVHGVNLSVGYEFDPEMFACGQSPLCAAVDRLVQSGVAVVVAAGNTGYGTVAADIRGTRVGLSNTINDPGNSAGAITVGSTHSERPYTYGVSYFSSKGPTADGRLKPDLVAPGERILSCAAGGILVKALTSIEQRRNAAGTSPTMPNSSPPQKSADYIEDSGTSMSAPHVSGAIAAFLSIRREFIGKPQEVKRIFLESASPLGRERYFEGHGLLDLMRAIQSV